MEACLKRQATSLEPDRFEDSQAMEDSQTQLETLELDRLETDNLQQAQSQTMEEPSDGGQEWAYVPPRADSQMAMQEHVEEKALEEMKRRRRHWRLEEIKQMKEEMKHMKAKALEENELRQEIVKQQVQLFDRQRKLEQKLEDAMDTDRSKPGVKRLKSGLFD